jgi:hypothetical protein
MRIFFFFFFFLFFCFKLNAANNVNYTFSQHSRDLKILVGWFEGEFDNEEQIWFQSDKRSAIPLRERHYRLHTVNKRVLIPELGNYVFLVKKYKDNNPKNIQDEFIVNFMIDKNLDKILMQKRYIKDNSKIKDISHNDLYNDKVCEFYWEAVADQYMSSMINDMCFSNKKNKSKFFNHKIIISKEKLWMYKYPFANKKLNSIPFKLRRVKYFFCEVYIQTNKGNIRIFENKKISSQGGEIWFEDPNSLKKYGLRIRDKEYPYYEIRPDFLFFSIREPNKKLSLGYSIHDINSRRLGINLNWISAHCHRDGYNFREEL